MQRPARGEIRDPRSQISNQPAVVAGAAGSKAPVRLLTQAGSKTS